MICEAILNRLVIKFIYDGETRIVETFALGYHKDTGNLVLRSYQVGGYSKNANEPPWRLFDMNNATELETTTKIARSDREYYNPNDMHMSEILCNV